MTMKESSPRHERDARRSPTRASTLPGMPTCSGAAVRHAAPGKYVDASGGRVDSEARSGDVPLAPSDPPHARNAVAANARSAGRTSRRGPSMPWILVAVLGGDGGARVE